MSWPPAPSIRGCGEHMSIQRAAPSPPSQACWTPTGTTPQAPGSRRQARPSSTSTGEPSSTKKLSSNECRCSFTDPCAASVHIPTAMCTDPAARSTSEQRAKPVLAPGYSGPGNDLIGAQDVVHCSAGTYNASP